MLRLEKAEVLPGWTDMFFAGWFKVTLAAVDPSRFGSSKRTPQQRL
jgi:hypothetical protein